MSAWRWCALAGLAALAVSVVFARIPGLVPCDPSQKAGAVLALELARNAADLTALFGAEPCTGRLLTAQRSALWLDMLAFIPAYALFLLSAVIAARRANLGLALLAFQLFAVAAVLDVIEGLILFRILNEMPGEERLFTWLFWTVRPKFALLGLGEMVLALMLWRGAALAKVASRAMMGGGAASLTLLFVTPHHPAMLRAHLIAWLMLLGFALVAAVRPSLLKAESFWPGAKT